MPTHTYYFAFDVLFRTTQITKTRWTEKVFLFFRNFKFTIKFHNKEYYIILQ